jgi:hypothetical protein
MKQLYFEFYEPSGDQLPEETIQTKPDYLTRVLKLLSKLKNRPRNFSYAYFLNELMNSVENPAEAKKLLFNKIAKVQRVKNWSRYDDESHPLNELNFLKRLSRIVKNLPENSSLPNNKHERETISTFPPRR